MRKAVQQTQDGWIMSQALPIVWGPARGLKIELKIFPRPHLAFALGRYEPEVAESLRKYCLPGYTVWECGAHIGYFTIMLAKLVGKSGKVVVFEPDPGNREATSRNVQINRFQNNVEILPYAVGENDKKVSFNSGHGATSGVQGCYVGGSLKDEQVGQTTVLVESVSLDAMLKSGRFPRPNILKMDIEGAELLALPHAQQMIAECRPIVFIESHNPQTDRLIWETFTKHGYSLEHVPTGTTVTEASGVRQQMLARPKV